MNFGTQLSNVNWIDFKFHEFVVLIESIFKLFLKINKFMYQVLFDLESI